MPKKPLITQRDNKGKCKHLRTITIYPIERCVIRNNMEKDERFYYLNIKHLKLCVDCNTLVDYDVFDADKYFKGKW